jgi:hypothetical protein
VDLRTDIAIVYFRRSGGERASCRGGRRPC